MSPAGLMYGFVSPINLYGIMVVVLRFFTDYKSDKGVLVVVPSRIANPNISHPQHIPETSPKTSQQTLQTCPPNSP